MILELHSEWSVTVFIDCMKQMSRVCLTGQHSVTHLINKIVLKMSLKEGYCTIIDRLYEVELKLNCPPGLHTKHLNLNQNGNTDFKILSALRDMSIKRLDGLKNSLLKCLSMWGINTVV